MPIALIALLVFIAILIVWNVAFKRSMSEAMIIGFIATCLFAGPQALTVAWGGIASTTENEVVYAALGFVFMTYLIDQLGIMQRILDLLNSVFGKVRGGPAYVDTLASSVMGALSGSNSGNAASTGAITGPWMVKEGWKPSRAATVVAGNSAMGAALPPSTSMVIMLGFAGGLASTGSVYLALLVSGLYQVFYRLLLITYFVWRDNIKAGNGIDVLAMGQAWKQGRVPILIYLGALIPIAVTIGPLASFLENATEVGDAMGDISIITWIPILIILFAVLIGWKEIPKTGRGLYELIAGSIPRLAPIGVLLFFAIAASSTLTELGLAQDIESTLNGLDLPKWVLVAIVVVLVALIAGPLSSTATVSAIGQVSMLSMIAVGIDPVLAITVVLVAASTEGSSPPASAPIFIASGIVKAKPEATFIPLIIYYLLPVMLIAVLVGIGVLPVPMQG
ncbi:MULTISPECIES: TRAP transporter large permease subunit [unclassified Brevibacterium]|uniref:TRAP transporter large permease subunit n=1 Tax=unclassified Brevibacterium TaxID=2614124 RepID=UPI001E2B3258|nr:MULTISPECIES: TRAP transporter large permease subunit [unclassified Brevibacterium]MCD1285485.1 C4-dicarboxylate ABC transporter permease [Brevibacterium sp. CCUG 69071]MDK8434535.1 TRAP transporter large permease subunit [Brevibacterium sp. H-BE7]